MPHNICFCSTKLSTPVEKSTQCERATEAREIAKISEITVTTLQEKGRTVKKIDRNKFIDCKREKRKQTVARIRIDR